MRPRYFLPRRAANPPRGVVAISAHNLVHFRKLQASAGRDDLDWLTKYRPIARAGYSIYLYRFP